MPYRVDPKNPKNVQHYKNGRWSLKQTAKSAAAAKRTVKLLYGIKGGMKPKSQKKTKH